jgi:diguanylate cyclase (GGDEF)-like protein
MCARSILFPEQVTYTPDASQEAGFADNPYVTGQLAAIRMYAAAPVLLDSGHVVGTLCVFDEQVRTLEAAQLERLHDLAAAAARILQLRRRVDTLAHAATTDALTGVRNRGYLVESLRDALQRWARGVRRPGVLYIDLDGFKAINDEHGHSVGDAVLRAVAERLQGNVRAHDVVARLGGDEFAIVMEDAPEHLEARLADVAERIEDALTDPVDLEDGNSVSAHASVGASVAEQPSDTVTSLLSRADAAMYAAKAQPDRDVS